MYLDWIKTAWLKPWFARSFFGFWALCILLELALGLHQYFSIHYMREVEAVPIPKASIPLDRKTLLSIPLFGRYVPIDLTEADIRASMLNLTVVGIFFSLGDEKKSEAMIKLPNKAEEVYHVGDSLPGGAVIKQIQPEEIFISHHGTLESLRLPDKNLQFDPPPPPME